MAMSVVRVRRTSRPVRIRRRCKPVVARRPDIPEANPAERLRIAEKLKVDVEKIKKRDLGFRVPV